MHQCLGQASLNFFGCIFELTLIEWMLDAPLLE